MEALQNLLDYKLFETEGHRFTIGTIVLVVAIYIATRLVLFGLKRLLNRIFEKRGIDRGRRFAMIKLVQYFVWSLAIVFILQAATFKVTLLLAGSAALLVGLGLGLQQIFQDLVSGIFILVEGTIQRDDVVEIDGLVGKILTLNLRTSTVLTRDGIMLIVPNHKFIVDNIINWSHSATPTRFKVSVGVAYGSDVDKVTDILMECVLAQEVVIKDKENNKYPFVRFVDFGDSALLFEVYFWSQDIFPIENAKSKIRYLIDKRFREEGVTIPFPQRDLHLVSGAFQKK
ncbi:MAG: mechanosensitive ion channel [Cyclobacteriaceae bacterium]|nr:mechanosensitive ion channel [Cyclobacteriaceae bacterium]MCB0499405.1 mechanosensitive ion channel [Cyclobacteriaceae bacterium]MCB9236483.1 mechanosensitive ion channel [Flammeovirgaceae bacterium]MCO5272824.1 mechanosensitive ion channel [Cyclobacteriaceae bacterium]MCW5903044.1 mechanosensitive ion channel [Cyclobacteriaceae bacterium]